MENKARGGGNKGGKRSSCRGSSNAADVGGISPISLVSSDPSTFTSQIEFAAGGERSMLTTTKDDGEGQVDGGHQSQSHNSGGSVAADSEHAGGKDDAVVTKRSQLRTPAEEIALIQKKMAAMRTRLSEVQHRTQIKQGELISIIESTAAAANRTSNSHNHGSGNSLPHNAAMSSSPSTFLDTRSSQSATLNQRMADDQPLPPSASSATSHQLQQQQQQDTMHPVSFSFPDSRSLLPPSSSSTVSSSMISSRPSHTNTVSDRSVSAITPSLPPPATQEAGTLRREKDQKSGDTGDIEGERNDKSEPKQQQQSPPVSAEVPAVGTTTRNEAITPLDPVDTAAAAAALPQPQVPLAHPPLYQQQFMYGPPHPQHHHASYLHHPFYRPNVSQQQPQPQPPLYVYPSPSGRPLTPLHNSHNNIPSFTPTPTIHHHHHQRHSQHHPTEYSYSPYPHPHPPSHPLHQNVDPQHNTQPEVRPPATNSGSAAPTFQPQGQGDTVDVRALVAQLQRQLSDMDSSLMQVVLRHAQQKNVRSNDHQINQDNKQPSTNGEIDGGAAHPSTPGPLPNTAACHNVRTPSSNVFSAPPPRNSLHYQHESPQALLRGWDEDGSGARSHQQTVEIPHSEQQRPSTNLNPQPSAGGGVSTSSVLVHHTGAVPATMMPAGSAAAAGLQSTTSSKESKQSSSSVPSMSSAVVNQSHGHDSSSGQSSSNSNQSSSNSNNSSSSSPLAAVSSSLSTLYISPIQIHEADHSHHHSNNQQTPSAVIVAPQNKQRGNKKKRKLVRLTVDNLSEIHVDPDTLRTTLRVGGGGAVAGSNHNNTSIPSLTHMAVNSSNSNSNSNNATGSAAERNVADERKMEMKVHQKKGGDVGGNADGSIKGDDDDDDRSVISCVGEESSKLRGNFRQDATNFGPQCMQMEKGVGMEAARRREIVKADDRDSMKDKDRRDIDVPNRTPPSYEDNYEENNENGIQEEDGGPEQEQDGEVEESEQNAERREKERKTRESLELRRSIEAAFAPPRRLAMTRVGAAHLYSRNRHQHLDQHYIRQRSLTSFPSRTSSSSSSSVAAQPSFRAAQSRTHHPGSRLSQLKPSGKLQQNQNSTRFSSSLEERRNNTQDTSNNRRSCSSDEGKQMDPPPPPLSSKLFYKILDEHNGTHNTSSGHNSGYADESNDLAHCSNKITSSSTATSTKATATSTAPQLRAPRLSDHQRRQLYGWTPPDTKKKKQESGCSGLRKQNSGSATERGSASGGRQAKAYVSTPPAPTSFSSSAGHRKQAFPTTTTATPKKQTGILASTQGKSSSSKKRYRSSGNENSRPIDVDEPHNLSRVGRDPTDFHRHQTRKTAAKEQTSSARGSALILPSTKTRHDGRLSTWHANGNGNHNGKEDIADPDDLCTPRDLFTTDVKKRMANGNEKIPPVPPGTPMGCETPTGATPVGQRSLLMFESVAVTEYGDEAEDDGDTAAVAAAPTARTVTAAKGRGKEMMANNSTVVLDDMGFGSRVGCGTQRSDENNKGWDRIQSSRASHRGSKAVGGEKRDVDWSRIWSGWQPQSTTTALDQMKDDSETDRKEVQKVNKEKRDPSCPQHQFLSPEENSEKERKSTQQTPQPRPSSQGKKSSVFHSHSSSSSTNTGKCKSSSTTSLMAVLRQSTLFSTPASTRAPHFKTHAPPPMSEDSFVAVRDCSKRNEEEEEKENEAPSGVKEDVQGNHESHNNKQGSHLFSQFFTATGGRRSLGENILLIRKMKSTEYTRTNEKEGVGKKKSPPVDATRHKNNHRSQQQARGVTSTGRKMKPSTEKDAGGNEMGDGTGDDDVVLDEDDRPLITPPKEKTEEKGQGRNDTRSRSQSIVSTTSPSTNLTSQKKGKKRARAFMKAPKQETAATRGSHPRSHDTTAWKLS